MDLMPDQHERAVLATDGQLVLLDRRQHRTQVVRRLLAAGISATTLQVIVPEWSRLISSIDDELRSRDSLAAM